MNDKWSWLLAAVLAAAVATMGCEQESAKKSQPPAGGTDTSGTVDPGASGTEDPGTSGTEDPGSGGTEDPGSGGTEDPGSGGTDDADAGSAADTKEACLLECGDGCFKPEHKVCGEDGTWWCPCEMACYGVAEAEDIFTCCEPVPSNCVPTCLDNKAMNCTSGNDEYGCVVLDWKEEDCGEGICVEDWEADLASCKTEPSPAELCTNTTGTWQDDACDCGPGGGWDEEKGCWGASKALCEGTGGTWLDADCGPFCGTCECPENESFNDTLGCVTDTIQECLFQCGEGCFLPEQKDCGEDGEWWCPCEMACHGVAEAEDISTCCEPVVPGCVSSCEGNVAKNCSTTTDGHGCTVLEWKTEDCGAAGCEIEEGTGAAVCKAATLAALCNNSGGDWDTASSTCDCGPGGGFDEISGCWAEQKSLCESTGGTWQDADCGPFCGTCDCLEGKDWDDAEGCK
jgi:hypothetical protein